MTLCNTDQDFSCVVNGTYIKGDNIDLLVVNLIDSNLSLTGLARLGCL